MKFIFPFLSVIFMLSSCHKSVEKNIQQHLKQVSYQYWHGGARGSGAGINVFIDLKKKLPDSVTLQKIEFRKRLGNIQIIDSLHYIGTITTRRGGVFEDSEAQTSTIDSNLKENQVKIFVEIKGKEYFYMLSDIKEREALMYP